MSFVHLQLHTEYSLLEGFAKIDKLFSTLKTQGVKSVAITDFGVMYGVLEFYDKAIAKGIKPIIGCEIQVVSSEKNTDTNNIVLLVENEIGYKNLIKLISNSYRTQVNYRPAVLKKDLFENTTGLICLGGGMRSNIVNMQILNEIDEISIEILEYMKAFGRDNYFVMLNDFGDISHKKNIVSILKLKEMLKFNVVATNDVHFVDKDDYEFYKMIVAIRENVRVEDVKVTCSQEAYLKTPQQMTELFNYIPEAIKNTEKIADRCNYSFDFKSFHLPNYPLDKNIDKNEYIARLCEKGSFERYKKIYDTKEISELKVIQDRINYELSVIRKMGYIDYFLIVWDFVNYAKKNNIRVGPCRGSGGGSIVAYCLKITDVDPLEYNLIFERFLNPERITMPDFDIDFQDDRRGEVVEYVFKKYSSSNVANIATFGHFKPKLSIRDTARALGYEYSFADKISKMIPNRPNITIEESLRENTELKNLYLSNINVKTLIDKAKEIENLPRHISTHAAGIVITENNLDEYVPLYISDDNISTQFNMTQLERLGLLKIDFLGLITLTLIENTVDLIRKNSNQDFNIDDIKLDDVKTFELISTGENLGIFQLESRGMREFMSKLKPTNIEDIIAGISLYRPGPMDSIPTYIRNKNNPNLIRYKHPKLRKILEKTYGCIVYQEQVMEIVRVLGGYSYGRADEIRRAMSKKKISVMEYERKIFINGLSDDDGNTVVAGCKKNGIDEITANSIYDEMIDFAKYAFNKSHATGYAILSYQCAYLKTYYKKEFICVLLSGCISNHNKLIRYIKEAHRLGIDILPADVNYSIGDFKIEGKKIRYGLNAIKNIGLNLSKAIEEARVTGDKFTDLNNFISRIGYKNVNKKSLESLIKTGSCDKIIYNRNTVLKNLDELINRAEHIEKNMMSAQISMFEDDLVQEVYTHRIKEYEELDEKTLQVYEKELLGDAIKNIIKSKTSKLYVKLNKINREDMRFLGNLFDKNIGNSKVVLYNESSKKSIGYSKGVMINSTLLNVLKTKYGKENVVIK